MKPILTMKAVANPAVRNPYAFDRIHFLAFNYDGRGSALVRYDNRAALDTHSEAAVTMILVGDPGSGAIWFLPE